VSVAIAKDGHITCNSFSYLFRSNKLHQFTPCCAVSISSSEEHLLQNR